MRLKNAFPEVQPWSRETGLAKTSANSEHGLPERHAPNLETELRQSRGVDTSPFDAKPSIRCVGRGSYF